VAVAHVPLEGQEEEDEGEDDDQREAAGDDLASPLSATSPIDSLPERTISSGSRVTSSIANAVAGSNGSNTREFDWTSNELGGGGLAGGGGGEGGWHRSQQQPMNTGPLPLSSTEMDLREYLNYTQFIREQQQQQQQQQQGQGQEQGVY
jgi:hypothetical protein